MTTFLLLNLHELLLLLAHLKLNDPSTASPLVSVSFLYNIGSISSSITYIFEYSLSLSIHLLLCLDLHSIAELCLFQHQTRWLLLLLQFVNFIRSLWSLWFHDFLMIIIPNSLSRGQKPKDTGTISGYSFSWWLHFLCVYIFRWLGIFIPFRIFNSFLYILSRDTNSRAYTH